MKKIDDDAVKAVAAYTGPVTRCAPGKACGPEPVRRQATRRGGCTSTVAIFGSLTRKHHAVGGGWSGRGGSGSLRATPH
jgi:hypothetical protein